MKTIRIIKRYTNRKLYDTKAKRYTDLAEIAALVRSNDEFKVVNYVTGEDITPNALAGIILQENLAGVASLKSVIQSTVPEVESC